MAVARELDDVARVTVVSDQNFLLFTPMLAEVASGDLDPRHIITPIREMAPRATVVAGSVTSIDIEKRRVIVERPFGLPSVELSADAIVIGSGSVPATFGIAGAETHALAFKTIGDALRIRNRLLALLEVASTAGADPALTHVAIVGAGYSGAELAASLADFLGESSRTYFPDAPPPAVSLIDAVDRVTPALAPRQSRAAARALERRGVELRLGEKVQEVTQRGVILESGDEVRAETTVWVAGVRPHEMVARLGLPLERGRLVVDGNLSAAPGIFALGDVAATPDGRGSVSPPTAQFALRQGRYLGRNLAAILSGRAVPPFRYRAKGELVSLGHRNAVGSIFGVGVSGFPAWFAWRTYYLSRLPGLLRKVRVALDWTLDLLFPPDIAWLPTSDLGHDVDSSPDV